MVKKLQIWKIVQQQTTKKPNGRRVLSFMKNSFAPACHKNSIGP